MKKRILGVLLPTVLIEGFTAENAENAEVFLITDYTGNFGDVKPRRYAKAK